MTRTFGEDPRTLEELRAEWRAGPRNDPPTRGTPDSDFERLSEVRSAMFRKMGTPASIRGPVKAK